MPVDPATLAQFALAVTAIVVSPGPDTMVILRHALASGRGAGLAAVAGVQLGLVVHTLLAVTGVSMIIASSEVLFKSLAVAGAAYLMWLGVQGLRDGNFLGLAEEGGAPSRPGVAWRQGMMSNILNPKVILLFLALFPNFVDTGRGNVTVQLLTLALVLVVINVAWQAPMALAADSIRRALANRLVYRAVTRGSSLVLISVGLLMLYGNFF
jgi:threonine/homoserine/homoserine lactone efflux protein